jgi:hypothetical protein
MRRQFRGHPTGYAVGKNAVGGELVGNLLDCAAQDADRGGGEEEETAAALHRSQQLQLQARRHNVRQAGCRYRYFEAKLQCCGCDTFVSDPACRKFRIRIRIQYSNPDQDQNQAQNWGGSRGGGGGGNWGGGGGNFKKLPN